MEPNNLGNGQSVVPEQSVMPEQPVAPELPNVIPMEPQPAVPEVPKKKMDEKDKNTIAICSILGAIIVFGVVGIILALVLGAGKHNNNTPNTPINPPVAEIVPSPELAESVCKKYSGEFEFESATDADVGENRLPVYICHTEDFDFEIIFLGEDTESEIWLELFKKEIRNDSTRVVLEDSNDFIKDYVSVLGVMKYEAVYKGVAIAVVSSDVETIESLLVELGFPDRSKVSSGIDKQSYDDNVEDGKSDANTFYLGDTNVLATVFEQYQANNYGKLPAIKNGTVPAINEYVEDDFVDLKTGNKYTIKAFADFAETPYATDDSELSKIKSDEMYVFYKATCENDKIVKTDSSKRLAVIHSTSDNTGYICSGN